jgi:hypothetical protein
MSPMFICMRRRIHPLCRFKVRPSLRLHRHRVRMLSQRQRQRGIPAHRAKSRTWLRL